MKKRITITMSAQWVLEHREDKVLPVENIKSELTRAGFFEVKESTFNEIVALFDGETFSDEIAQLHITDLVGNLYPESETGLSVEIADFAQEPETPEASEKDEKGDESGEAQEEAREEKGEEFDAEHILDSLRQFGESKAREKAEEILGKIHSLVGADEFKALADEIVKIAPETERRKSYDVFNNQCYLFSVGDGCGLTTYLRLLKQLVGALGLRKMAERSVSEEYITLERNYAETFGDAVDVLVDGEIDKVRVLCVDISEWIGKTEHWMFKKFLRTVEKHTYGCIVVFRVPFVDKEVLADLKNALGDLLTVRTVSFPPFGREEVQFYAGAALEEYGFRVGKTAWRFFHDRIAEEKSDGKFYGLNTVKKVVRELVYNKQLDNARRKKPSDIITQGDTKKLCRNPDTDGLTGTEMLEKLVGNREVKEKVREIVAQIETSLHSDERPCIHMRFVGNPGTGKTTVARIIGKILRERGVLRIGNFYEHGGRDFCGRYVGETAPKTLDICREAYGSVLFIDEAYSLYRGNADSNDFGREAIDTLIAEMENHRDDFIVIMAGYTDEMNKLMDGNQGLKSRMPYTVEFPNFTREELCEIYVSMARAKFKCDEKLFDAAREYFLSLSEELVTSKEFSNARFVRNLFERTWAKAAMRCQLDRAEVVLTKDDFERACAEKDFANQSKKKTILGF